MALSFLYANEQQYCALLDRHMKEASLGAKKYRQLTCMADPDRARVATTVHQSEPRQRMHLVYPSETVGGEMEEVVLYVQGFLVDARLPPILAKSQLASEPARSQQTVTLSGVGSLQFARAILGIQQIYAVFDDHCSANELLSWTPRVAQGHPTLTMSNRYFTESKGAAKQEVVEFPSSFDPLRILRNAVPSGIYSNENQVLYYDQRKIADSWKHIRVQPTAFKLGQLVEVQLSFTAIPNKHGKYVLVSSLRSVCTLDRTVENDMNKAAVDKLSEIPTAITPRIKRRVGYFDSDAEEDDVQGDLKRMRLDLGENMHED